MKKLLMMAALVAAVRGYTVLPAAGGETTENIPSQSGGIMTEDMKIAKVENRVEGMVLNKWIAEHVQGFWLFAEDRTLPIHPDVAPAHWFEKDARNHHGLELVAQPGEFYPFQFCVMTLSAREFDWSISSVGETKTDSITEISRPHLKVGAQGVKPVWTLVTIPKDASGKCLRFVVRVRDSATGESHELVYDIRVEGESLGDGGVKDAWRLARLKWLTSDIGREHTITKPFKKILVEKESSAIRLTGKTLFLGEDGLPARITSRFTGSNLSDDGGEFDVLAEPFRFEGKGCGDGKFRFTAITEDEVEWESGLLSGWCDYTGSVKLRIKADTGRLVVTMPSDVAKYMEGLGRAGGEFPEYYDWRWNVERHQDALWVGRVNAGLAMRFKGANYRRPLVNAYYNWRKLNLPESWGLNGGITLAKDRTKTTITAWGEGKGEYGIDLYLTPFHKFDLKSHFADRYHQGSPRPPENPGLWAKERTAEGVTVFNLHHATLQNPYINYPYNDDGAPYLKKLVDAVHESGALFKIYYTTRELSQNVPEFFPFLSLDGEVLLERDRTISGWPCTNAKGPHPWLLKHVGDGIVPAWREICSFPQYPPKLDLAVLTVPETRFDNFYLEGLDLLIKEYGIDGLYIDDTALPADAMKRARRILDRDGKRRLVDNHSWNHHSPMAGYASSGMVFLELYPFFDRLWRGEAFDENSSPEFWLTEMSGLCYGLGSEMLHNGGNKWRGLTMAMTPRYGWGINAEHLTGIWRYWDSVRLGESEMFGWWDESNPLKSSNPAVKITVYRRPDGVYTVVAANFTAQEQTFEIFFDSSSGFKPATRAVRPAIDNYQAAEVIDAAVPQKLVPGGGMLFELCGKAK